ncbi:MAG: SprT-like domain-containing protein [Bacteroidota bacterium]
MNKDKSKEHKDILANYFPLEVVDEMYDLVVSLKIHLKVSKSRKTKLGDYCPPVRTGIHRITINYNLNKYEFLITFIHEVAHLKVWNKYAGKVLPHGNEWKNEYLRLMVPYIQRNIFTDEIKQALVAYFKNPGASKYSDNNLVQALRVHDDNPHNLVSLEKLPINTKFILPDGRTFIKGELRRKCYKCQSLQNKRFYIFQPLAKVNILD